MNAPTEDISPAAPPARRLGQIDALDGFRGCAVLIVVIFHLPAAVPSFLRFQPRGGALGVDAFFVLSGFLITALLLRDQTTRGRVRFGAFYRRRAMRLLPALVTFLAVYMFYEWATDLPGSHEPSSALSVLFYYLNTPWRRGALSPGLGHLWSLSVEEQFYMFWPLLLTLFLGIRRRTRTVTLITVAAIVAVAVHRTVMWDHGVPWLRLDIRLDTRADTLLVGCLIAQLWVRKMLPKRGVQTAASLALAWFLYLVRYGSSKQFQYRYGFTFVAIALGIILVAVLQTNWPVNRVLRLRPLRVLGRVSYAVYIWHLPIFKAVSRYALSWAPVAQYVLAIGLTALAASISWFLVERPFLRWKDRIEHSDHAAPEAAAGLVKS